MLYDARLGAFGRRCGGICWRHVRLGALSWRVSKCLLTCPSTRTPTGARSLRSHRSAVAGYVHVIHRRASRFVRSAESRERRARFKRCVAGVGFNGRACGGRRRLKARWHSAGWPLSVCGATPLRKLSEASSGSSAANIRVVRAWPRTIAAKHPRANILNLAEPVSWRRACSQVASEVKQGRPMHNKAVNTDAQGRQRATRAPGLGRGLLLRYTSAGISFRA
jgi:hypothetical protein